MAALKLSIAAKDRGLPLESSGSSAEGFQTDDNSTSGTEFSDTKPESDSNDVLTGLNHDSHNDDLQSTHVDHPPVTHNHPLIPDASMTVRGYQLVGRGGNLYNRVFTNSAIKSKNGATDHDLYWYSLSTNSQLSKLIIPFDALGCSDVNEFCSCSF